MILNLHLCSLLNNNRRQQWINLKRLMEPQKLRYLIRLVIHKAAAASYSILKSTSARALRYILMKSSQTGENSSKVPFSILMKHTAIVIQKILPFTNWMNKYRWSVTWLRKISWIKILTSGKPSLKIAMSRHHRSELKILKSTPSSSKAVLTFQI